MRNYLPVMAPDGSQYLEVDLEGNELLQNSLLNKSTSFTPEERKMFGLEGLLPPGTSTLVGQVARVYENYLRKPTDLDKYLHLRSLQDRNEVLFYALVSRH